MANDFTCIIVDDEVDAIELLSERISLLYNNIKIIACYTTWKIAFNALREKEPDILFLDVFMPEKTGMDLLKMLPGLKSEIIFTTAYKEHAIDAFAFSATGYILKPVDDQDLLKAIDKAVERIVNKRKASLTLEISKKVNDRIGIPNINGVDYVNVDDILYFETVHGYTKVVTNTGDIVSSFSIGKFKDLVEVFGFYQPHRSYIVNLKCISSYKTSGVLIMLDKKEIPISKNIKDEFLHLFNIASKRANDTK